MCVARSIRALRTRRLTARGSDSARGSLFSLAAGHASGSARAQPALRRSIDTACATVEHASSRGSTLATPSFESIQTAKLCAVNRERDTEQTLSPMRGGDAARNSPMRDGVRGGQVEAGSLLLAPRSAGEIVDLGLDLLRGRFGLLVGLCTLLWVPVRLLQPLVGPQAWQGRQDLGSVFGQLAGTAVVTLAAALVQTLANAAVALYVFGAAQGSPPRVAQVLNRAMRCLPGVLVLAILGGMAALTGLMMCILPYFYALWKFALAPSIYVLEQVSLGESIRRSFALSTGTFLRWTAAMALVFVLAVPYSGLSGAVDVPEVHTWIVDTFHADRTTVSAVLVVVTSVFMGIASAVTGVISTVFYLDCLVRREGRDLRARLAALGSAGSDELRARPIVAGSGADE